MGTLGSYMFDLLEPASVLQGRVDQKLQNPWQAQKLQQFIPPKNAPFDAKTFVF